jgi:two-component system nitrate/nitrite response regulator NarL
MSPQMAARVADAIRKPQNINSNAAADSVEFSPREREVIIWLARGGSNKEIARALNMAESTVKIHVQGILRKLNLSSRVQAAVYAVEHGLADSNS